MKKILISAVALAIMVSPSVAGAAYNDANLTTDTIITVGGIDLNIAGSTATVSSIEVVNSGNSLVVILEKSSTIKITSADRRVLTTDAPSKYIITDTCDSSVSTLELASYEALVTITITPTTTICTVTRTQATSGTGRGGGAATSPAAVAQPIARTVVATAPTALATSASSIKRTLTRGTTGDDVKSLQTLLSLDPTVYPEKLITGYFGPATERAVKVFQAKYNLPDIGVVGPMTRAMLTEIFGKVTSAAPATPATLATGASMISRSLKAGSTGSDVKQVQQFLNKNGFTIAQSGPGSPGNETAFFGSLTVEAIKKFQAKYGIASSGDPETTGYGNLGPKTRAKLNELMGQ